MSDFLLTDDEITDLRAILESALFDTCIPQTRTEGTGGYGYGKPTYTDGAPLPCLFEATRIMADEVTGVQAERVDAYITLSRSSSVSNLSRLKMTKFHGDAATGLQVYEIVGGPVLDHIRIKYKVLLVTDGSQT
jgi:hypothetical protein